MNGRILLIEPNTRLAYIYSEGLKQSGYSVAVSSDAQAAILMADEQRPDAVVLELQLAAHNGIEFLYEFRSYAEWQAVPVILLTLTPPHALRISRATMQQLGIVDCLYKPTTTLRQLHYAVSGLLPAGAYS
jgi:DNA-binding response OmpR family regulator